MKVHDVALALERKLVERPKCSGFGSICLETSWGLAAEASVMVASQVKGVGFLLVRTWGDDRKDRLGHNRGVGSMGFISRLPQP
jgi:hypothetical protein